MATSKVEHGSTAWECPAPLEYRGAPDVGVPQRHELRGEGIEALWRLTHSRGRLEGKSTARASRPVWSEIREAVDEDDDEKNREQVDHRKCVHDLPSGSRFLNLRMDLVHHHQGRRPVPR